MTLKINQIFLAFASLLLLFSVSAFVIEDILESQGLSAQVESLQISPETKLLAISINQVDQVVDENGDLITRPRVLALDLSLNEKQLIEEGMQVYENIPAYAVDVKDGVDMLEAELMNEMPSILPAKVNGWADVEYDEDQDVFYPRVVLQTQISDKNTVGNEVVQVIIDLPETGEVLVFPPHKLPSDQVYYLPVDGQNKTPYSVRNDYKSHKHLHKCGHKHMGHPHKHHHECGHKHMKHAHKYTQNYLHNVGETIDGWCHKAAKKINEWVSDNIGEIQLFALIWIIMVAVVMLFVAFPILYLLHIRRSRREAHMDLEATEALLKDEDIRDEKVLSHQCYPVKIDQAFSTGEEKGLLDDQE